MVYGWDGLKVKGWKLENLAQRFQILALTCVMSKSLKTNYDVFFFFSRIIVNSSSCYQEYLVHEEGYFFTV